MADITGTCAARAPLTIHTTPVAGTPTINNTPQGTSQWPNPQESVPGPAYVWVDIHPTDVPTPLFITQMTPPLQKELIKKVAGKVFK